MKRKTLYISFAILIFALLVINLLLFRVASKIQPANMKEEAITQQQHEAPDYAPQPTTVPGSRRSITIIRNLPREKQALSLKEKAKDDLRKKDVSPVSSQESAVSSKQPEEASSGGVKINKPPTKEEIREMNSRGIIIY